MVPSEQRHPDVEEASTAKRGRVLVVDDERNIRSTLQILLQTHHYQVDVAQDGNEAQAKLAVHAYEVVLLDVRLPGATGIECLDRWKREWPDTTYILMSGEASLTEALEGLKLGAFDFIEKPILSARLLNSLKNAVDRSLAKRRIDLGQGDKIIGDSIVLKDLLRNAEKAAKTKARILIGGASGTGKDLLARYVHLASTRSDRPFIKVNCASIPADLVESELFGHMKGAFTGAVQSRSGHFQAAHGGTLFLDEIGELPLPAQAKMLRALQNGEITPVGSSQTIHVDVRVIAATNRDLRAEVTKGTFREDLYYRIAVVCLESPSLCERPEDVVPLAQHFLSELAEEYGIPRKMLDTQAEYAIKNYRWPGNIRELRNVMERCMILGGSTITLTELPPEVAASVGGAHRVDEEQTLTLTDSDRLTASTSESKSLEPWHEFKMRSEKAHILKAIDLAGGSMSDAARLLGVERQTIYKWVKAYGIER